MNMVESLSRTKRSPGIELPPVKAKGGRDGGALIQRRRSQMINLSQNSMRCRATKEIRTHEGLVRRFTEGTIQGVIDNLGRQLINVRWDSGITTYVFFNEIELTDDVQLSAALY
jgi:hypothetical protein